MTPALRSPEKGVSLGLTFAEKSYSYHIVIKLNAKKVYLTILKQIQPVAINNSYLKN